jgi:hypothetical protein
MTLSFSPLCFACFGTVSCEHVPGDGGGTVPTLIVDCCDLQKVASKMGHHFVRLPHNKQQQRGLRRRHVLQRLAEEKTPGDRARLHHTQCTWYRIPSTKTVPAEENKMRP